MKQKLTQFLLLATVAPVLAACGTGGKAVIKAPLAELYAASYAETPGQTFGEFMDAPGKKIEGAAIASRFVFKDDTSDTVNDSPKKLIIELVSVPNNGSSSASAIQTNQPEELFKVTYGTTSVTFTRDDMHDDDFGIYFEKFYLSEDDKLRTIAYIYALDDKNFDLGDKIVVPLGLGFKVKADGNVATADGEGVAFVNAYTVLGLETNPDKMPKDRTATYQGGAEMRLDNKVKTHAAVGTDVAYMYGNTEMVANFESGKITGSVDITSGQIQDETSEGRKRENVETIVGASFALSGDIVSNGFTTKLEANDVLKEGLESGLGITDLEATGVGRFYGTEAEGIGALLTGESTNYVFNGVIWGEVSKP